MRPFVLKCTTDLLGCLFPIKGHPAHCLLSGVLLQVPGNTSHATPKGSVPTARMELVSDCRNSAEQQPPGAGSSAGTSWDRDHQVQVDTCSSTVGNWVEDPQSGGAGNGGSHRDAVGHLETNDKSARQNPQPAVQQVESSVPPMRPTTFGTKSYAGALKVVMATPPALSSVKPTLSGGEHGEAIAKDPIPGKSVAVVNGGSQDGTQCLASSQPAASNGPALASTSAVSLTESSHSNVTDSSHGSGTGLKPHKGTARNHIVASNTLHVAKGPPTTQVPTVSKVGGKNSTDEKTTRSDYGSSEESSPSPPVVSVAKSTSVTASVIHKGSPVLDTPSPKTVPTNVRQPVCQPSVTKSPVPQSLVEPKQTKPSVPSPPLMELTVQVKAPPQPSMAEQADVVVSTAATPKPDLWYIPAHQGLISNQSWPGSQQLPGTQHGLSPVSQLPDQGTLLTHHGSLAASTFSPSHSGSHVHLSSVGTAVQSQPLPFSTMTAASSQPAVVSSQDNVQQSLASADAKSNLSIAAPAFVPSRPSSSPSSVPQSNLTPQTSSQLRAEFLQPASMSMMSTATMHRPRFPPTGGIPPPPAAIRVPSSIAGSPATMLGMFPPYPPPLQLPVQAPPLVPAHHHFMMPHTVLPLQQQQQHKVPSAMLAQGLVQQLQMAEPNPSVVQVISPGSEPIKSSSRRDAMRGPPHTQAGRHQSRSGSDRHASKGSKRQGHGFDSSPIVADIFPAQMNKSGAGIAKSFNKAPLLPTPSYFPGTQPPILPPQMQMLFGSGLARMPPFLPGLPRSNSTSFQYSSRQY